jgi:similar to stage IV sporulation protein
MRRYTGVRLYTDVENRDRFVSIVTEMGISARIMEENDGVTALVSISDAKKIASALDKSNIIVYINNVCGIYNILSRAFKRIGLMVGGALFLALLLISTAFVFKVEVSGAQPLSREQVKDELALLGVRAGARINAVNTDAVRDAFLTKHPEFSFAAVSIKGTTVCIELMEKLTASTSVEKKYPLLVADTDCVIKYLTVVSGKPLVKAGAAVRKGDLLISGYVSGSGLQYTDDPILRYDGAAGKVYAEMTDTVIAEVPFEEQTVRISDESTVGFKISLLGLELMLGRYVDGEDCHTQSERNLTVFGVIELPITVHECKKTEKSTFTVKRSEAEASAEARRQAFLKLNEELSEATLLHSEVKEEITEHSAKVTVVYGCLKNVAVPKDIEKKD